MLFFLIGEIHWIISLVFGSFILEESSKMASPLGLPPPEPLKILDGNSEILHLNGKSLNKSGLITRLQLEDLRKRMQRELLRF